MITSGRLSGFRPLVLGSTGVRHGYVSRVRYTHYSLLRTIEAALGLRTLTGNDRYAQPVK